jgi:WD40 repeat protein
LGSNLKMPTAVHSHPDFIIDEDMVTAVGWSSNNELLSVGDDHTIQKWAMDGEPVDKVWTLAASSHAFGACYSLLVN